MNKEKESFVEIHLSWCRNNGQVGKNISWTNFVLENIGYNEGKILFYIWRKIWSYPIKIICDLNLIYGILEGNTLLLNLQYTHSKSSWNEVNTLGGLMTSSTHEGFHSTIKLSPSSKENFFVFLMKLCSDPM